MAPRFLGITVLGDYILSEGVEAVIENLMRIGATAVATNPTVTTVTDESTGSFQPPNDAGSSPRVFDRPLFGKTSLWVRSGPSYQPNPEYYQNSKYGPRKCNDLTDKHGAIIGHFLEAAKDAGLKTYFQIGAAQPSGLRDEDRPQLPDGTLPVNRVADVANLASQAMRDYNRAYVRDLVAAYPQIDGFRPDWPEYPCYTLGECFQGFGPQTEAWANRQGHPYEDIRTSLGALWKTIFSGEVDPSVFERIASDPDAYLDELTPAMAEWLIVKRDLSREMLAHWREILTDARGPDLELSANAFMWPYTQVTGFDFTTARNMCDAVSPKLYTMHWSQMVEFWGRPILDANPHLEESLLVDALCALMQIHTENEGHKRQFQLADYGYPEPDQPHPISSEVQAAKIEAVCATVGKTAKVTPLVHGYGPLSDVERRLQLVADSPADGVWINRYGYLGDQKLNAIARIWNNS